VAHNIEPVIKHQNWAVGCSLVEENRAEIDIEEYESESESENEQSERVKEILFNKIAEYEVELEWMNL
jgi:hypothetical protein